MVSKNSRIKGLHTTCKCDSMLSSAKACSHEAETVTRFGLKFSSKSRSGWEYVLLQLSNYLWTQLCNQRIFAELDHVKPQPPFDITISHREAHNLEHLGHPLPECCIHGHRHHPAYFVHLTERVSNRGTLPLDDGWVPKLVRLVLDVMQILHGRWRQCHIEPFLMGAIDYQNVELLRCMQSNGVRRTLGSRVLRVWWIFELPT